MNILDIVKNYLPSNLAGQIAENTGESESGISKVISAALPTILGSLISKSSGNSSGVFDMVKGAANSGILGNLTSMLGATEPANGTGFNIWTILKSLFGDKLGHIVSALSSFGGVKESTANSVLGITSAATLGAVGKYSAEQNLDANGLSTYLNTQKNALSTFIPAGFDFAGIGAALGLGGLGAAAATTANPVNSGTTTLHNGPSYTQARKKQGNSWLVPLVILAAVGGLIWWFTKDGCNKNNSGSTATDTPAVAAATVAIPDTPAATTAASGRESFVITLPSGATLNAYKGGIEDQMVQFIQSDEYKNAANDEALKNKWFNFDNLNFEFGTTKITEASTVQLDNIIAILKEFKDAKIKVGAYTDKKGDDAGNLKLSQGRADAVKAALTKAGVGAQVTGAEGYGEKFATVDENADDKAREADRKTAIRFSK
ncbi:hypothetical protein DBR32_04605 [Taibaiella sp. KBW10]|uniref:OmpA family protein n=1 Tax=Taibaiella sp. KBW10 TaxID=2153357 RepID=UPI000F59BE09|nr:OmpA family protein [Taibaiella sp. KBW10]RQO31254.1 hypothetical protein DBR32_04605 [Taibaiella sp. KBW10]